MKYKSLVITIFFLFVISSCSKSEKEISKSITPEKPVEVQTLSRLGEEVLGKPFSSLGIPQDKWVAVIYKSVVINGSKIEPTNPIANIRQFCNAENQMPLGNLFGELGCNRETAQTLKKLSAENNSGITEICDPKWESGRVRGFTDKSKRIYWTLNVSAEDEISSVGVYSQSYENLIDGSLKSCDPLEKAKWDSDKPIREAKNKCKTDSTTCKTVEMLMENFQGISEIRNACADSVRSLAKWDYQFMNTTPFSSYWESKSDLAQGKIKLIDDSVKFQNGFGAWQRRQVTCHYDLKSKFAMSFVD